jgi:serine/threonine protein kinase
MSDPQLSANVVAHFSEPSGLTPTEPALFHQQLVGSSLACELEAHDGGSFLSFVAGNLLGGSSTEINFPTFVLSPCEKPGRLGALAHFEVIEELGRGGMGVVFRGLDTRLNRPVAVKVMQSRLAAAPNARQGFLREARAAARVAHENVVTIHAVDEADGVPFLVMEHVQGRSLAQMLAAGPLSPERCLRIGAQVARGLAAAHAQGLVHRDIKPANILLEEGTERVKITDFGLAHVADDEALGQPTALAGTPQFMSPEQAAGCPVDARSDLFSLGAVLYAMCAGRPPFLAATSSATLQLVAGTAHAPVRGRNPAVPEALEAIIDRLLAKRPEERFQSAAEVAEALSALLAPPQASRTPRLSWLRVAGAAAILLLLAGNVAPAMWPSPARVPQSDTALVVEVRGPGVHVSVDGEDVVLTGSGVKEVRLKAASHGATGRNVPATVTTKGPGSVRINHMPPPPSKPAPETKPAQPTSARMSPNSAGGEPTALVRR